MNPHLPATFRALRHHNFRLWFFGQGFSLIGTWMQMMAQQVLVYRLTGSATALGIVTAIGLIPLIPLSLWGGSIADRISRRTIILLSQSVMMVQAFILAALTWQGVVQIWHVYVLAFVLGAAQAIDMPARQAFIVDMVAVREDLTNAIALNSTIFNGARALSPALAGTLVAALGEGPAFFLNGLSFVAVIISLLLMRNLPLHAVAATTRRNLAGHMAEGFRYILSRQTIVVLISLVAVSAFMSMPYSTLQPVFAGEVLNASARPVIRFLCDGPDPRFRCASPAALPLGILLSAVGVGAVIGALAVASLPDSVRRGPFLTLGNLGFPALLIAFSLSRSFLLSMFLLMGVGASFVFQNSLANTLLQLSVPDEVRGRVMSVYTLVFQSMMRLGGLQAGLMADRFGAPFAVFIGALISLGYGLYVAVRYPRVRNMA
jgi:MFS family permease